MPFMSIETWPLTWDEAQGKRLRHISVSFVWEKYNGYVSQRPGNAEWQHGLAKQNGKAVGPFGGIHLQIPHRCRPMTGNRRERALGRKTGEIWWGERRKSREVTETKEKPMGILHAVCSMQYAVLIIIYHNVSYLTVVRNNKSDWWE